MCVGTLLQLPRCLFFPQHSQEVGKASPVFLVSHRSHAQYDLNEAFQILGADGWKLGRGKGVGTGSNCLFLNNFYFKAEIQAS